MGPLSLQTPQTYLPASSEGDSNRPNPTDFPPEVACHPECFRVVPFGAVYPGALPYPCRSKSCHLLAETSTWAAQEIIMIAHYPLPLDYPDIPGMDTAKWPRNSSPGYALNVGRGWGLMAVRQWKPPVARSLISTSTDGRSIVAGYLNYRLPFELRIRQGQDSPLSELKPLISRRILSTIIKRSELTSFLVSGSRNNSLLVRESVCQTRNILIA